MLSTLAAVTHPPVLARTTVAPPLVKPGVLLVVLMPLRAVSLVGVVLGSVFERVALVFGTCSVSQVRQSVVRGVSIQVTDDKTLRTRSYEGQQDQLVDVTGSSVPVPVVDRGSDVASTSPWKRFQDATLSPSQTRHASLVADFVQTFMARYRAPLLHGYLSVAQRRDNAR